METKTFAVKGMHCASCAMNIDGELEDSGKVASASTSYSKAETKVEFDPTIISEEEIQGIIQKVGYTAERVN